MCLIWFSLLIKESNKVNPPAAFLNDYFRDASSSDEYSDED